MNWDSILKNQLSTTEAFVAMYQPIVTADAAEASHIPAETPQKYMDKCLGLQKVHSDQQLDLQQEISLMAEKLVKRAETARLHSKPLHKTIKHRENMKLDYERYLSRVEHARRKEIRTPKDETALAKHESDLAQARISYQTADDHVKENFPGVIEAIHSLMPYLLTSLIMLQTTMVGQLYTVTDEYTRQYGLPNPAPSDQEIISTFEHEYTGLRKELENSLQTIARGKVTHLPMTLPEEKTSVGFKSRLMGRKPPPPPPSSQPSISPRPSIGSRHSSTYEEEAAPAKPPRPTTAISASLTPPLQVGKQRSLSGNYGNSGMLAALDHRQNSLTPDWQRRPSWSEQQSSGGASPPSRYATPVNGSSPLQTSASNAGNDYFGPRRTSTASSIASAAAAIAAKKKPPPPVPVKRIASSPAQYVTALYDFEGQNPGDLPFREGDRIRVVKKTDSTDDWWDGEIKGVTGSFPANYVQL